MNSRQHRSRDHHAPAPESRTMVIVTICSVGVGLLAFALGVHYGLGQEPAGEETAASKNGGVLGRLDQQQEQLRKMQADRTALSFHQSLSGPAVVPKRRPAPQPGPALPAAAQRAGAPVAATSEAVEHKPGSAQVVTAAESEAASAVEDNPGGSQLSAAAVRAIEQLARIERASDAVPAVTPPGQQVDVASATDTGEEEESTQEEVDQRFSLQVGAFPDQAAAESLAARMRAGGYPVRIVNAEVNGRGTWYRVRVGSFGERVHAEKQRTSIATEQGVFALVVPER